MANPFKELDNLEESEGMKAPPSIKHKVLGSYGFIVGIGKVVEFVFGSFTNVLTGMLSLLDPPTPPPNPQNEIMAFGSFVEEDLETEQNDEEGKEDGNSEKENID